MHGLVTSGHRLRQRQSARRHFRHGKRAAATRAFTGARLYLNGAVPTLAAAADSTGSNVAYVQAAIVLLKADNASLVQRGPRRPRRDPAGGALGTAAGRPRHCLPRGQGSGSPLRIRLWRACGGARRSLDVLRSVGRVELNAVRGQSSLRRESASASAQAHARSDSATLPPPMRPRQLRRPTPINWREWTRGRGMA